MTHELFIIEKEENNGGIKRAYFMDQEDVIKEEAFKLAKEIESFKISFKDNYTGTKNIGKQIIKNKQK